MFPEEDVGLSHVNELLSQIILQGRVGVRLSMSGYEDESSCSNRIICKGSFCMQNVVDDSIYFVNILQRIVVVDRRLICHIVGLVVDVSDDVGSSVIVN